MVRCFLHFPPRHPRGRSLLVALIGGWLVFAAPLNTQARHATESAGVGWRLADADCPVRLVAHQRDARVTRSSHASEHISLSAGRGTYLYLVHDITHARVIAEWAASLWVMADRSGLQFMARVVLPRTRDPRTGSPLTTLLRGEIYERPGSWQQLRIHRPDQLLERQVRVLRAEFGSSVDDREAYVDLVVLNAYGGVGTSNVWLDELEIAGQVPATQFAAHTRGSESVAGGTPGAPSTLAEPATRPGHGDVRVNGSVVIAGGVPFFPRVIEGNGESLEWLQSLGFNAVQLQAAPTAAELHEAERLGLWLIAPPPNDGPITAAHDRVLAWDLGSGLADEHLELTRQRVTQLRRADPRPDRPLIGEARERVWNYSRLVSFLVLRAAPIGTSLSLPRYGRWLQQHPTLARPGTPSWAAIQTEPPRPLVDQWSALGLGPPLSMAVEPGQIRQMTYEAVASGARGLLFASRTPLDGRDAESQRRARVLRHLNLELQVIEPWAAAGSRQPEVHSDRDDVRISILQTERAQLLVILSQDPHQQFTRGPAAPGPLSLIVPSAANAPQVYRLLPGGLRTMTHRRVAGGIRLTLEELGPVNLVAIAQDPLVLSHLTRSLAGSQLEVARLHRQAAVDQLELVEALHQQAVAQSPPLQEANRWLEQARANLRHCELLLGASDHAAGYEFAERALESLARVRRTHWNSAAGTFPSPAASPYCVWLPALPLHWEMARRLQAAPNWSLNLLPAGDFESLEHLRATGWQNYATENRDLITAVELSTAAPRGGHSCLRMTARSKSGEPPAACESPPLRIISAPVPLRRGQLLRVHGWARIIEPIEGSLDGLKIYDSLGGEALALRLYEPGPWQHFVLYRAAPHDTQAVVTMELTGTGEVWIDDVEMSVHEPIAHRDALAAEPARHPPPVAESFR